MIRKTIFVVFTFIILLALPRPGVCLTDRDMAELRKSGISSETLALLIRERSVETGDFTVREIINLKKAGMSGKNIRMLIKETSPEVKAAPIIYGTSTLKRRIPSVDEIITLKKAGVSDDVIQAMIVSSAANHDNADIARAWQMLNQMDLRVDQR